MTLSAVLRWFRGFVGCGLLLFLAGWDGKDLGDQQTDALFGAWDARRCNFDETVLPALPQLRPKIIKVKTKACVLHLQPLRQTR